VAQRRARSHRGPEPVPVQRRGQGRHAVSLVLSLASIGQVHTSLGGAVTWLVAIRAWVRHLVCELEAAAWAGERGHAGRQDAADVDEQPVRGRRRRRAAAEHARRAGRVWHPGGCPAAPPRQPDVPHYAPVLPWFSAGAWCVGRPALSTPCDHVAEHARASRLPGSHSHSKPRHWTETLA